MGAESSRYPYKGRSADGGSERYVSKIPMPRAAAAPPQQAGKLTPGFGEHGQPCKQKPSPMLGGGRASSMLTWPVSPTLLDASEVGSRGTVSVCDDEPDVEGMWAQLPLPA